RADLSIPLSFPAEVERAALAAAGRTITPRADRIDARDIEFLTIDPAGSRDLDQAYFAERTKTGIRVRYAIADVASFVTSGDLVDREARTRGATIYLPDRRAGLHPECIAEDAASLLPRVERPALLWTIELDGEGAPTEWRLEPAIVRSREAMTHHHAQQAIERCTANESLALLREIGELRQKQERLRGGVSISPPSQEVTRVGNDFELAYEMTLPVEKWNAQVSLLAGICAASTMIDGGVGIVRTLPPPSDGVVQRLRRAAHALGIVWSDDQSYADVVRGLASNNPAHSAFLTQALDALRGAGYSVIDSSTVSPPTHAAIAAPYAHVTAPLRRLADRFANEIVLALCAEQQPPAWATEPLADLPEIMQDADRRQKGAARAVVDLAECLVLRAHVGQTFMGAVIDVEGDHATVLLSDLPVIAALDVDDLVLGASVELQLAAVDLDARRLEFSLP
ncbi:MAG: RNB domain-containing ribonuclease, partial [Acidimicrobiia bacterium]|nr:RNB domain-containing ribonuclease [Acidimicrobiia bacterium]